MTNHLDTIEITEAVDATAELTEALARFLPQLSTSAEPFTRDVIEEIVREPNTVLLIARDHAEGGAIVGSLTLVLFRALTGLRAWRVDVVVDTASRRRGIGAALTRAAIDVAMKQGARTVDLTSRHSRKSARLLYERLGFTVRNTSVYRYIPRASGKDD
jgi:ribosomal protein S18 acetylase RimI-like enzyme